ncbi:hypothetical protein [Phenylobacterium sp.]|jgi:hypothetical protein|uniref:hypothetical protein n=1 Tax=Phenylobacterium sp. TaxID=1871053 RepID=UPI0025F3025C|nr:hypothetical protein [Phenylobacterium sp.]
MSISAVSNTPPPSVTAAVSAPPPSTPKDNDGDNDNGAPDVKAATPAGVGTKVDIQA